MDPEIGWRILADLSKTLDHCGSGLIYKPVLYVCIVIRTWRSPELQEVCEPGRCSLREPRHLVTFETTGDVEQGLIHATTRLNFFSMSKPLHFPKLTESHSAFEEESLCDTHLIRYDVCNDGHHRITPRLKLDLPYAAVGVRCDERVIQVRVDRYSRDRREGRTAAAAATAATAVLCAAAAVAAQGQCLLFKVAVADGREV